MAIRRAQVTSLAAFAAWMQENAVPSIFKSVSYDSEADIATATDADDNVVLEIKNGSDGYLRAYRGENNYLEIALVQFPATNYEENKRISIIGCDNGFIVDMKVATSASYGAPFAFLISKTNNNKIAVVWPSEANYTENQQYTTDIQHVAFGDSQTLSTVTTFTPETAQQTTLCPFGTNADVGTASYTTDAYYMPMGQNYNSGLAQFSIGNDHFITNGFWAIRTGGDE